MEMLTTAADDLMGMITSGPLAIPTEVCHYTITVLGVKQAWNSKDIPTYPFMTWFFSMVCCAAGGGMVALLCGAPPLKFFTNTQSVMLASAVWFLVFHMPGDIYASLVSNPALHPVVYLLKEMTRAKKILKGIAAAQAAYPGCLLLSIICGVVGACGGGFLKNGTFLLTGKWNGGASMSNFRFSTTTKLTLLFSVAYNLQMLGVLVAPMNVISLVQLSTVYFFAISGKFGVKMDPFAQVESLLCGVAFEAGRKPAGKVSKPEEKKKTN